MLRKMVNNSLAINPRDSFISDERDTATISGLVNNCSACSLKLLTVTLFRLPRNMKQSMA